MTRGWYGPRELGRSAVGRSLAPLFAHLAEWASDNLEKVEQSRQAYDAEP